MQNKRLYAVLVLAAGIVLAALHVADLLQWMDASTGFALQGSVWARYLPWLAALALPYLPARRVAAQPTELTDTNLPLGCCMLMTGALLLGSGLLSVSSAQTISAYPELYATTPAWTAWADVITPVLAGAWLLVYGWRALTGFGVRRQKLGGALRAWCCRWLFYGGWCGGSSLCLPRWGASPARCGYSVLWRRCCLRWCCLKCF